MYKLIVAGSRNFKNRPTLEKKLFEYLDKYESIEIVSGTARGADRLGENFANKYEIPLKRFPANWDKFGKSAGYLRNKEMAEYADGLLAFWDGKSKGTKHMINLAKEKSLNIEVVLYV